MDNLNESGAMNIFVADTGGCEITNDPASEHIGIGFENREAFESWIYTPFLAIELSCGCKKEYSDKKDIPTENVKCEHDNYFIKIGE